MAGNLDNPRSAIRHPRSLRTRGLSLVEMIIALAISAMLLTATMAALDASFKAYGSAAEQASSQAASRMIAHRLMTMIRTSTAHGPLEPDAAATPPVTLAGNTITSHFIELLDAQGTLTRIEFDAATQQLVVTVTPASGIATSQPIIGGVSACQFHLERREANDGTLILSRATMDLTVKPGEDATLSLENGEAEAIRVIVSTMPRRVAD